MLRTSEKLAVIDPPASLAFAPRLPPGVWALNRKAPALLLALAVASLAAPVAAVNATGLKNTRYQLDLRSAHAIDVCAAPMPAVRLEAEFTALCSETDSWSVDPAVADSGAFALADRAYSGDRPYSASRVDATTASSHLEVFTCESDLQTCTQCTGRGWSSSRPTRRAEH
jgi:hypothetical protein